MVVIHCAMARGDFPSAKQDQFMVRFPDGMRDRIRKAAEANNRSMNAEIIHTLENAYPIPITVDDIATDIQEALRLLKRFKGNALLMTVADSLDDLMVELSRSGEGTADDREAVKEHVEKHGKFTRFVPPRADD